MQGATSKSWLDFETKLITWEARVLDYEKRSKREDHLHDSDKCRLLFDMIPPDAQQRHDELLEIGVYSDLRAKLMNMMMRGKMEEKKRGGRINLVGDYNNQCNINSCSECQGLPVPEEEVPEGTEVFYTTPWGQTKSFGRYVSNS